MSDLHKQGVINWFDFYQLDKRGVHTMDQSTALWFNRGTGSEMGVAQLLALNVFSSTTLEF